MAKSQKLGKGAKVKSMTVKDELEKQPFSEMELNASADEQDSDEDMDSMHDLYEQSFRNIQEGEVIAAVSSGQRFFVMVDMGTSRKARFRSTNSRTNRALCRPMSELRSTSAGVHDDDDGTTTTKEKAAR